MNTLIKTGLVALMLMSSASLLAPSTALITIAISEPIQPCERLMHAIGMVETKWDTKAFNPVEQAAGVFQIRPIRLRDYNTRTGSKYTTNDLYDPKVSEKIFLYYASKEESGDYGRIARGWNGSGPKTFEYWKRVRKEMDKI